MKPSSLDSVERLAASIDAWLDAHATTDPDALLVRALHRASTQKYRFEDTDALAARQICHALSLGADPDSRGSGDVRWLDPALCVAAQKCLPLCVEALLAGGADPEGGRQDHTRPLGRAMDNAFQSGADAELCALALIAGGADPHAPVAEEDSSPNSRGPRGLARVAAERRLPALLAAALAGGCDPGEVGLHFKRRRSAFGLLFLQLKISDCPDLRACWSIMRPLALDPAALADEELLELAAVAADWPPSLMALVGDIALDLASIAESRSLSAQTPAGEGAAETARL